MTFTRQHMIHHFSYISSVWTVSYRVQCTLGVLRSLFAVCRWLLSWSIFIYSLEEMNRKVEWCRVYIAKDWWLVKILVWYVPYLICRWGYSLGEVLRTLRSRDLMMQRFLMWVFNNIVQSWIWFSVSCFLMC